MKTAMKFLTLTLILSATVLSQGETTTPTPTADSGSGQTQSTAECKKRMNGIGLKKVTDVFTSTGDTNICGSEIKEICMTPVDLEKQFKNMANYYRRLLAGRCKQNGKALKALSDSGGIEAIELAVVKDGSGNVSGSDEFQGKLSEKGVVEVEKFFKPGDNTEEKTQERTDKLEDITKTNVECVKTIMYMYAAMVCQAAKPVVDPKADPDSTIVDLGTDKLQFAFNTTDAKKFLTDCSPYVFSECQLSAAEDASDSLNGLALETSDPAQTEVRAVCANIAASTTCVESAADKCSDEIADEVAKVLFPIPGSSKGKSLGRSVEGREKKAEKLGEIKTKAGKTGGEKLQELRGKGGKRGDGVKGVKPDADAKTGDKPAVTRRARILIARLLEDFTEGTATVSVAVSGSALKLIEFGESCGFDIAGLSMGTSILMTAVLGSLLVLVV